MPPGLSWGPSEIDSTVPLYCERTQATHFLSPVSQASSSNLASAQPRQEDYWSTPFSTTSSSSQQLLASSSTPAAVLQISSRNPNHKTAGPATTPFLPPLSRSYSTPTIVSSSPSIAHPSLALASSRSTTFSPAVRMPLLALGTWQLQSKQLRRALRTGLLECGYRHLDCASVHNNEAQVGEALEELFEETGSWPRLRRENLFITSKLWSNAHGPPSSGRVLEACRRTLRDLRVDYLDCYLIHYPVAFLPSVPREPIHPGQIDWELSRNLSETWKAMEELVDLGLVRSIGVSNFEIEHLEQLLGTTANPNPELRIPPMVNQIEMHPYSNRRELVDYCHRHSIAVMAYSPLGSPDNPWTRQRHFGLPSLLDDPVVEDIAERLGKTPAQVLLRWALQRGNDRGAFMGAVVKSSNPDHIRSNAEVFDFRLSAQDLEDLSSRNRGTRFNHPITPWLGRGSFPRSSHPATEAIDT